MIMLGQLVQDRITGLIGVATARTEFLYGCVRIMVQPRQIKDGKSVESSWIDEPQLEPVTEEPVIVPPVMAPAGPRDDVRRAMDVGRARDPQR